MIKRWLYRKVLHPLIARDLRLRLHGKRLDNWHWADLLAMRWGFLYHDDHA